MGSGQGGVKKRGERDEGWLPTHPRLPGTRTHHLRVSASGCSFVQSGKAEKRKRMVGWVARGIWQGGGGVGGGRVTGMRFLRHRPVRRCGKGESGAPYSPQPHHPWTPLEFFNLGRGAILLMLRDE
jgi:hypothetical protein